MRVQSDPSERWWRAFDERDRSFDGIVFAGVVTTGVYCRLSCPGRPKRQNVRFFATPAAARAAGLRACKRCHPDEAQPPPGPHQVTVALDARAPFDWSGLLDFHAARAVPGVEEVLGSAYCRSLSLPHSAGVVTIRVTSAGVDAEFALDDLRDLDVAIERCRALLDLDADPASVANALGPDATIGPLVSAAPGRRIPGHVDGAELAIRAVLGQQVSVAGARTLAARLVQTYGRPLAQPTGGVTHLFPTPARIAEADPRHLAMPAARQRAVRSLASALASGELSLHPGYGNGDEASARLLELPGIGPWTASYIAMRALRDRDAFLPTDLGVVRALEALGVDARPKAVQTLGERWRPFRSYAVIHLWASLTPQTPKERLAA
jgi:AraC family transcriptional regulator of adaptative response / DNA-3-methyladenine glycosylase II